MKQSKTAVNVKYFILKWFFLHLLRQNFDVVSRFLLGDQTITPNYPGNLCSDVGVYCLISKSEHFSVFVVHYCVLRRCGITCSHYSVYTAVRLSDKV